MYQLLSLVEPFEKLKRYFHSKKKAKKRPKKGRFQKKIYEPTPDVSVIILGGTIRKAEALGEDDATVGGDEPGVHNSKFFN